MTRRFELIQSDVFTETPLSGNPLAVVPDARGLDEREMQSIAQEMNLSETTFVLPAERPPRPSKPPMEPCRARPLGVSYCQGNGYLWTIIVTHGVKPLLARLRRHRTGAGNERNWTPWPKTPPGR